jgi:hypothetical protein
MYTGTMLDELMAAVSRAEQKLEPEMPKKPVMKVDVHATYTYEFHYNEERGVA